jgi:hypothetical protein
MQITLPHPPAALSPNGNRHHWAKVSSARKQARLLAALATAEQLRHTPLTDTPTTYSIIWNHYGTIQPDDDNVIARIKSYKDGICDTLNVNDRTLRLAGLTFIRDKATKKTLTIIIE